MLAKQSASLVTFVGPQPPIPASLADRIRDAYRRSCEGFYGAGDSMWSAFTNGGETHRILLEGSTADVVAHLSAPHTHDLFYGFESLTAEHLKTFGNSRAMQESEGHLFWQSLVQLADAVGAKRVVNPAYPEEPGADVDALLDSIETVVGPIDFPNPFAMELGLPTRRGVVSYRPIQAIYQAHRIKQLSRAFGDSVLEIGAGLGRTAYYSHRFGIRDYRILDLPQSGAAQALFLCQVLGDVVSLNGETPSGVHVGGTALPDRQFDIIVNVDSLPEIDRDQGRRYAEYIAAHCKAFLSINHEAFPETVVGRMPALQGKLVGRHPYWMRPGYVEELYAF